MSVTRTLLFVSAGLGLGVLSGLGLHPVFYHDTANIAPPAQTNSGAIPNGELPFPHQQAAISQAPPSTKKADDAASIAEPATEIFAEPNIPEDLAIPPIPRQKPLSKEDQEDYVLELFSPSADEVKAMQTSSAQYQRLEQTMVMAYLLSNCGLMPLNDYQQTYQALVYYLQANHYPNAVEMAADAASRARASYQLVYRYVPCDDPSLSQIADSLKSWHTQILPQ